MAKLMRPTLRERNRYLAIELLGDYSFERKAVVDAVWGSLLRLHGEVGAAKTSLWVMDWDPKSRKGILKVNHKSVETLRTSIALVREIEGRRAAINVVRVCGTLKSARDVLGLEKPK